MPPLAICMALEIIRLEAEAVPDISNLVVGLVVPIPILPPELIVNLSKPKVDNPKALAALLKRPVSLSLPKVNEGEAALAMILP